MLIVALAVLPALTLGGCILFGTVTVKLAATARTLMLSDCECEGDPDVPVAVPVMVTV